ncbi:MAG: NADP-dependent oxidoreductase [Wenzhouxiangellaceae bacterium]
MRALQLTGYGDNRKLELTEVAKPEAAAGEVLVKVAYAGLNPVDYKTRSGQLRAILPYKMPQRMGNEISGEVEAVGAGVTRFAPGDKVMARLSKERMGGFADYVAFDAALATAQPQSIGADVAAGVPLVSLTAWQCLFEYGKVGKGSKVLIHAGAGAVGRIAIQLAKNAGATVATTVSERGREVVQALGADIIINYKEQNFAQELRDYDFVLDAVGGATLMKSFAVLRRGGKLCSIAGVPEPRTAGDLGKNPILTILYGGLFTLMSLPMLITGLIRGVGYRFVFMRPDGEQLRAIAEQIDSGRLQVDVAREYRLEEYAAAFDDLEHATTSGKLVFNIAG